jgi:hypothetical protein
MVGTIRTWPHSGCSVDQSVFLPAGDRAGIEHLVGYMTRCPFRQTGSGSGVSSV